MRRAFGVFVIWAGGMVLLATLFFGVAEAYRYWQMPVADKPVPVVVERGETMRDVAASIHAVNPVLPEAVIYWTARFRGQARAIQSGEYEIAAGERLGPLLDRMASGDVIEYSLTIPEGVTARRFLEIVAGAPRIERTLEDISPDGVIEALELPVDHLEGWLYPDTYRYPAGTTDRQLIRRAHRLMREHLEAAWAERDDDLPIETPYEALILASVIERETAISEERGEVAGVFVNRLQRGMRLQTDPTVIYGMGDDYDGVLLSKHLRQDTPYNTYTRDGLPPTPIALPSKASLVAATRPTETDALFFVADGSGGHHFSRTLQEHNRAVLRWRAHQRGEAVAQ
ncbi:endolytic transglycosylase MltG [Guyparkeria sp.]|uniref:endolytic transglycosylase MltG n=1 Tax=Guyparkeria sp. TaxID=2035736 RepID=UPI003970F7C1